MGDIATTMNTKILITESIPHFTFSFFFVITI
jgi:hypothetical protein